jgi:Restriction endonuclease fold toxin 5
MAPPGYPVAPPGYPVAPPFGAYGPPVPGPPPGPVPGFPVPVRRRRWLPWAVGGGIGFVVLLLCAGLIGAGVLINRDRTTPDPAASRAAAATANLTDAANRLFLTPGARFRGSFTDPTGRRITLDAQVGNAGSVLGTLTGSAGQAQVLTTDGKTFVKADAAFWSAHAVATKDQARYAAGWVRIGPDLFGVDLGAYLAPELLAEDLAPAQFFAPDDLTDPAPVATPAGTVVVDGVPTDIIDSSIGLRVYVSTGQPRRVVRVTAIPAGGGLTGPSATPTPGVHTAALVIPEHAAGQRVPARRLLDDTGLQLDLTDLTEAETSQFYTELQSRISALSTSIDSQVQFSLDGDITLTPCTTNGCVANVTLSNRVTSTSPYLSASQPVTASVTVTMTLDGAPLKTCTTEVSMAPNGTGTTSCAAVYNIPAQRNPTTHEVQAEVSAYAEALVTADLQRLADDLAQEIKANRELPPLEPQPAPTAGGTLGPSAAPTPSSYPCLEPTIGDSAGGPGAWTAVNHGGSYRPNAPWRRYQEQVSGLKLGTEYRVNRPGQRPIDFDGFAMKDGKPVFLEAKGRGYAGLLEQAQLDKASNKLTIGGDKAREQLTLRLEQIQRQLAEVSKVPGAKLRYVVEEQDALAKIKAYVQENLVADQFGLIDWEQVSQDWNFAGCP